MAKLTNELKTGIAVIGSILILAGLFFKTGDLGVSPKGYTIKTKFTSAAGIKRFAPVRLAGVEVGEVHSVKLVDDEVGTHVEAELWIESSIKVRTDSQAMMSSLGLMGEKYVEIRAGQSPDFVEPGGAIEARDPVNFDELMQKAGVAMEEATETLAEFKEAGKHIKEILNATKPKLIRIADNLDGILEENRGKIDSVLTNLDGILDVNRPKIDSIMTDLAVTAEHFKAFSEDVRIHPWKVLAKSKEKSPEQIAKMRAKWDVERERLKEIENREREALKAAQQRSASTSSAATSTPQPEKNKGFLFFSGS